MNRKANGAIVVLLVVLIILGIGGYFASKVLLRPAPSYTVAPTPSQASIGDIDRSGAADEGDKIMIQTHLGCTKDQHCWNEVVGKTKDGDNPIYVFDLDLDKNGAISQKDIDLVK